MSAAPSGVSPDGFAGLVLIPSPCFSPPAPQNRNNIKGDFAIPPSYRKRFIIMPFTRKQLLTSRRQLHCALQLFSPYNKVHSPSAFFNELHHGYSGNKSKTHSDLNESDQNPSRPENVHQKKNKPISGHPSQSPQSLLHQKITGKKSRSKK
jgi:hypothetical protein